MHELEQYHAETLKLVIEKVNEDVARIETQERAAAHRQREAHKAHQLEVDDIVPAAFRDGNDRGAHPPTLRAGR